MIKEILQEKEEIVYYSLLNAIKNHRLSKMILLSGPKNPLKIKTAYLLAQTIIEDSGDFACEECNTCQRVLKGEYLDMIYIDGNEDKILKSDIDKLFEEFYQTSVEINNKKVFIINNINNSTDKVLNMILKFIEEPKDNVYGILISDEIDSLLETVKSRCQIIPFRELSKEDIVDEYMHDGFERLDAYLLMNIFNEYQKIDLNDELYLCARDMVYRTIEILDDAWMLEMEYQNNLYGYKDKKLKSVTDYYLSLMITVINDSFGCEIEDNEYQKMIAKLENYSRYELLDIFLKAQDMCKYNYDRKLLLDSVAYKLGNIV